MVLRETDQSVQSNERTRPEQEDAKSSDRRATIIDPGVSESRRSSGIQDCETHSWIPDGSKWTWFQETFQDT